MERVHARCLLDLAYDAGQAEDLEEFRAVVATSLRSVVPGDNASCTEVQLTSGRVAATTDPPGIARELLGELGRLAHQHPLITRGAGNAEAISDYLPARSFQALELYQDFYRHVDTKDQIAINLPAPPDIAVGVTVGRSRRGFSDDDRMALDMLRPVLARGYRRALARQQARESERRACSYLAALTRREQEVLEIVAYGKTNDEVARLLCVSRRTIDNHLSSIYHKLGTSNRTATAAVFHAAALRPPP